MTDILLKFDDFFGLTQSRRQQKLDKFIHKEKIKVNWGIIGNILEQFSQAQILATKDALASGLYSFFNHGYFHNMDEFKLLSLEEQIEHLQKTQEITFKILNIKLSAFGAPCNALNEHTRAAVEKIEDIRFWYFGTDDYSKTNFKRELNIEVPLFRPNYQDFKKHFSEKDYSLLVLQCHPNNWGFWDFYNFKKIIRFLKKNNCRFIFPEDLGK